MMLFPALKDYGWGNVYRSRPHSVSDVPKEEQIKARLRELTEDSRRLRAELEQLIRYAPNRSKPYADDRPNRFHTAQRRRKPR